MLCQRGNFQVVSTALSQSDDATKGLDYISKLLVRFRVIEVTYDLSEHPDSRYTVSKKLCELHEQLREEFISLYAEIIGYQFYLSKHYTHNQFSRLFRNAVIPDDWKDMASSIEQRLIDGILATLHQSPSTVISSQVSSVSQNVGQMLAGMGKLRTDLDVSQITSMVLMLILISLQELSQYEHIMWLPRVEYAVFNEYRKDAPPPAHCCKDRRENTLDQIEKWREGYDEHCIFWLSRMAGTGKPTIARTVANMFYQKNRLGANFLFSRGKGIEPRPTTSFPFFPLAWRQ